jgi:hypothetical protein
MVNYKVHRVRFIPYIPQAIHCLAVEGKKQPRIAISRYVITALRVARVYYGLLW